MRGYLRMQGGPLRKAACFAPVCVLLLCSAFMPWLGLLCVPELITPELITRQNAAPACAGKCSQSVAIHHGHCYIQFVANQVSAADCPHCPHGLPLALRSD